jgi:hypothetical protein
MTDSSISPAAIREEFQRLIVDDLLGPAGGPDETLPTQPVPRDRYLVGLLAPKASYVSPSRFDAATAADPSGGTSEDHVASPPQLVPSALGLTFAVPAATSILSVDASWGHYVRMTVQGEAEKPERIWQRSPCGGTIKLILPHDDGALAEFVPDSDFEQVVVTGRVRRLRGVALVTLFLVNRQLAPEQNLDEAWLFQATLAVHAPNGDPVFLDKSVALPELAEALDPDAREALSLGMLYRHSIDFAVGHGVAVHAIPSQNDPTRAARLETRAIPEYDVARTDPPTAAEIPLLADVALDMRTLAHADDADLPAMLQPLVTAYRTWIDDQQARIGDTTQRLSGYEETASHHIAQMRAAADRIAAGIALLERDELACEAFRFANEAMWRQRIRQRAIDNRRRDGDATSLDTAIALADVAAERTWRPFQLAFLLLNLPSLADPRHPDRTGDDAVVDLLFFPTGGGKTEAYLGLAAYVLAIRRLQGTLSSDDGDLDGSAGLAVLMRYTLRLLTAQQFQRAAALIAACEVLRRARLDAGDVRFGATPFRLGLWIGGSSTPNTTASAHEAIATARQRQGRTGSYADPLKIASCPWCGTALSIEKDVQADKTRARTLFACPDPTFACAFTMRNSNGEGLPVVTVDEEIYRLLPAFVIATVDKFAQLARQGPLHTLFGRVYELCSRHGYRSFDITRVGESAESDSHAASNGQPAATTTACSRLRPPDLIIQDELHLISGPLGTLVGLYETAIDELASAHYEGNRSRPKVVASTATIRRAENQVRGVFARGVRVFPPPGLAIGDSFFARSREPSDATPGRRYLGICARGQRMKAVEARVAITVLAAAQLIFERHGDKADPYMTLLAYFSSLRELAGMKRLLDDDVQTRLPMAAHRGLGRRRTPLQIDELTSRVSGDDIVTILERLAYRHTKSGKYEKFKRPLDVALATNMISVGVDVPRLGLMIVAGQPKSTAEYIQATSRVGRSAAGPGLVLTLYNWSRPRDVSHYERFEHDHATFYKQVEPLSVTPFSERALDRGLTAVVVAVVRHRLADRTLGRETNPDIAAQRVPTDNAEVDRVIEIVSARSGNVTSSDATRLEVKRLVRARLDLWLVRQRRATRDAAALSFIGRSQPSVELLNDGVSHAWDAWSVPNSLREVEREVNFLLDVTDPNRDSAPDYVLERANATVPASAFEDDFADDDWATAPAASG